MPTNKTLFLLIVACVVVFGFLATASPASAASSEKVLYSFCSGGGNCADGGGPDSGVIIDSAGNLYGTNLGGTGQYCVSYGVQCGTVFELIPSNGKWTEKVLYSFCSATNCADGDTPNAGLIFDKAGNLYGSTVGGGANGSGTAFELIHNNDKWTEKVLYNFGATGSTDALNPYTGLVFDKNGNLYGTTGGGGTGQGCQQGCGTVYELIHGKGKWTEKVLHNFNGADGGGYNPLSVLILDKAGNLYGTTEYVGPGQTCSVSCGTVFELIHRNGQWTEKVLHTFNNNGKDGIAPRAGVIFDNAGNLYGTTNYGGTGCGGSGCGTVFQLSPGKNGKWTEKVLHSFDHNGKDGDFPLASLIFDEAGNIYGTTDSGGAYSDYGIVFELVPNAGKWTERVLHSFNLNGQDGADPFASGVVRDKAGNLYGTTGYGGAYCNPEGCGTVFEVTP